MVDKTLYLVLTDDNGNLLERWRLSTSSEDEQANYLLPLRGLSVQALVGEINRRAK